MKKNITKNANRTAISNWEDEGGAGTSDRDKRTADRARTEARKHLDSSHESNVRGEHRYSDIHQTPAERTARQNRDDLKRRLAEGPATDGTDLESNPRSGQES
jgi:hypothetical protein